MFFFVNIELNSVTLNVDIFTYLVLIKRKFQIRFNIILVSSGDICAEISTTKDFSICKKRQFYYIRSIIGRHHSLWSCRCPVPTLSLCVGAALFSRELHRLAMLNSPYIVKHISLMSINKINADPRGSFKCLIFISVYIKCLSQYATRCCLFQFS